MNQTPAEAVNPPLIIRYSWKACIFLICGGLAFVAGGGFILFASWQMAVHGMPVMAILIFSFGLVSLLMGVTVTFDVVRRLASGRPGLIADDHGILDTSSIASFGLIEWSDVALIHIGSTYARGVRFTWVGVHVNNNWKYLTRINPVSRAIFRWNPSGQLLTISDMWLEDSAENIETQLKERWRHYRKDHPRELGSAPTFRPRGWDLKR